MADPRARKPQLRLTLPAQPLEDAVAGALDEAPFFRPKTRTRARRARRGALARSVLGLQVTAVAVMMLSVLWAGYSSVVASERLKVARVEVSGERFLSEGEVVQLLGPAMGESILGLDLQEIKAKLRASPWVADATVSRTLPDTLHVEIRERVPLALAEAERLYLMDGDGTLIDIYGPRTANFDLPIVRGLQGKDAEERLYRAQRAGALLRDLGELGNEISEVQVESSGDLRLVMRGHGEVLRLGVPPYRRKFLTFLSLRKDLLERCPDAEYFDLRFKDRIYAKERGEAAPTTPRGGDPRPGSKPAPAAGAAVGHGVAAPPPDPSPHAGPPPAPNREPVSSPERSISGER